MFSLVVGASKGVGAAVSAALEGRGDEVARLDRRSAGFDLENESTWKPLLEKAQTHAVGWENLIFCQRYREEPDWRREMEVGVESTRKLVDKLLPFASGDGASIVVLGSPASQWIASEQPVQYHMIKAALVQWARFMAVELGPKGIRVNVVTPARIERQEKSARLLAATPLRRIPDDADVAEVVLFLSSPASRAVTGQEIFVDGGLRLLAPANLAHLDLHNQETT